jgi:hypothetical protein
VIPVAGSATPYIQNRRGPLNSNVLWRSDIPVDRVPSQIVNRTAAHTPSTTFGSAPHFFGDRRLGGRGNAWLSGAGLFLLLLLGLKLVYLFDLGIDSDETQHLHVVWGWANGLLPYRDLFDNHSPLFQFLCAPLFHWLGERADIVIPMRAAVLPLYVLSLWMVYRCARVLGPRPTAVWAAALAGAFPLFFVKTTEFRTDDLWAVFWLIGIYLLMRRPFTSWSALAFGLTLGACFATSLKTTALLLGLIIALALTLVIKVARDTNFDRPWLLRRTGLAIAGALLLPALIVAFFGIKGALPQLYYCTVRHNLVPHSFHWLDALKQLPRLGAFSLVAIVAGRTAYQNAEENWKRDRLVLLIVSVLGYFLVLGTAWPIVQPQDFMPVAPLVALILAAAVASLHPAKLTLFAAPAIAGLEVLGLIIINPPKPGVMANKQAMIDAVLGLTTRDDFVMDAKGESVFRRRPFYYVLEGISMRRLAEGLIEDDIPERLIQTRTPLATLVRMPPAAHEFIKANYLPIAFRTRVLGKMLNTRSDPAAANYDFDIAVPATYVLLTEMPGTGAMLDGQEASEPQFLQGGHHRASVPPNCGRVAVVWSRAIEKQFSPFAAVPPDNIGVQD